MLSPSSTFLLGGKNFSKVVFLGYLHGTLPGSNDHCILQSQESPGSKQLPSTSGAPFGPLSHENYPLQQDTWHLHDLALNAASGTLL